MIDHTLQHTLADPPRILGVFGAFGVSIFFVISGFIIAYIHSGGFTPSNFMRRRIMRVVPLYWICTLFLAVCAIVLPSLFKTTVFTPEYLLKSLAFLPMAVPGIPDDWRPLLAGLVAQLRNLLLCSLLVVLVVPQRITAHRLDERRTWEPHFRCVLRSASRKRLSFYFNFNLMPFLAGMWIAELQRRGVWARFSIHSLPVLVFAMLLGIATLFTVDFTQGPLFIEF
ncbi:acyltransferase [Ochrobactrum oryzae]|nr:acyltransferase [Brucella oryzae]